MTTPIRSVMQAVVDTVNDAGFAGWSLAKLVRYFNDAQRDILIRRPDLFNIKDTISLAAGVSQALPTGGEKLIRVIGNDTATSKRAVTPADLSEIDLVEPAWRSRAGAAEILHYQYDLRDPRFFDVYPPARVGAALAIEFAQMSAQLATPGPGSTLDSIAGDIGVPDLQQTALHHYMVFRMYSEDAEIANSDRAQAAFQLYAAELGLEVSGTVAAAPAKE